MAPNTLLDVNGILQGHFRLAKSDLPPSVTYEQNNDSKKGLHYVLIVIKIL